MVLEKIPVGQVFDGGIRMQTESPHQLLKEKQRQERADLILQAAEAILMEKGYHETSMDEIAARVGVSKGTVYQHFPSKEELIFALLDQQISLFLQSMEQVFSGTTTARAKLELFLDYAYQELDGKRTRFLMTIFTSMDAPRSLIEQKMPLRERMEQLQRRIHAVLEEGKAAGEFDLAISTDVMAIIFLSLISPMAYMYIVAKGQLSREALVAQESRLFFQGISAKK
ncbi:MAG: TetR/AcrR family transcriptional regulator [Chloroflexi bacterium]|nr:TetR/AcrR family transcriptional regulator [Chloroflexota bacterium]